MRRLLAVLLALAALPAWAQVKYPVPNNLKAGSSHPDASTVVWAGAYKHWIMTTQTQFYVFDVNGTLLTSTTGSIYAGNSTSDHEGSAVIAWSGANSDRFWVQSENGAGMSEYDIDDFDATNNATPTEAKRVLWNGQCGLDGANEEGLAFYPDAAASACLYGGYFLIGRQDSGNAAKICIPSGASFPYNLVAGDCIVQNQDDPCSMSEIAGLDYDFDTGLVYWQSDNGNNVCTSYPSALGTQVGNTISDLDTSNTWESVAVAPGRMAYAEDGTGGSSPCQIGGTTTGCGLWLYDIRARRKGLTR